MGRSRTRTGLELGLVQDLDTYSNTYYIIVLKEERARQQVQSIGENAAPLATSSTVVGKVCSIWSTLHLFTIFIW
jgi:hypothetical protein